MSYKKILVAIDRSPQSEVVFAQALEIAKKEEASLMLFHCLPIDSLGIGSYVNMYGKVSMNLSYQLQEILRQEKEEAQQWLVSYAQKAAAQGVSAEWDMKVGDPSSTIRELAKAWNADLIVLGRRGRRGLAEVVLGSVSNHIVHYACCSVLVVQGTDANVAETPISAA